ncbi:MAG: hypothetical protein WCX94_02945, partial [Candidatus Dojkabacteria bacterium]
MNLIRQKHRILIIGFSILTIILTVSSWTPKSAQAYYECSGECLNGPYVVARNKYVAPHCWFGNWYAKC